MATFYFFGKYTQQSLAQVSAERTKKAVSLIEKHKGKVKSMDALLGEKDIVFVVDLPSSKEALKVSLALAKSTGIAFTTSEAVAVSEFDKLAAEV
jgi:uncharacterized protein with GYD domain